MTAGWKTSEFWLSLCATLVSLAMASGFFANESWETKALSFAAAILSSLGYTVARTYLKSFKS